MTVDLRQLECFLAVAKHLHFGRAADELYLAQPTVSESVRRLERELGGALFERTTRRVALTPLGEAFAEEARAACDRVQRAYERGRTLARGQENELAVGYAGDPTRDLLEVVAEVQRRCPGGVVSLRPMPTPKQVRLIRAGRLHAGVGWEPAVDDELTTLLLGSSPLVVAVPSDHPLAARDRVTLTDLAPEPLIGWARSVNPALYDAFAAAMDTTGRPWTLVGTAVGAENVAARVLSGFGIGVTFEAFVPARAPEGVTYVRVVDESARAERVLVWPRREQHGMLPVFARAAAERFGRAAAGASA